MLGGVLDQRTTAMTGNYLIRESNGILPKEFIFAMLEKPWYSCWLSHLADESSML